MSILNTLSTFSQTYAEARRKFLAAAHAAHLPVMSYPHPLKGRDGEDLATDVVRLGPPSAARVLIVSSACHGVEGFCGSGPQIAFLESAEIRAQLQFSGIAVLLVHALNPHGFSHWRRVTEDNIDLNRNFQNFSSALPANPGYAALHDIMLPPVWPPVNNDAAAQAFIAEHGMAKLQAVVSRGQHTHADGLFFGGTAATWSNRTIRQILRDHCAAAKTLGWIDIHTGLGPVGVGELILATRNNAADTARTKAWWGDKVVSFYDGTSSSAELTGLMIEAAYDECPNAAFASIALEFGTVPTMDVMRALRADHWLAKHPETPADQALAIKQQIRDAFYVDTDAWKEAIWAQTEDAMMKGLRGLKQNES